MEHIPLHNAVLRSTMDSLRDMLTDGWPIEVRDALERTTLMVAARADVPQAVPILCAAGADIEAVALAGFRPLHFAAQFASVPTVRALLDAGATVDALTQSGKQPLDLASEASIAASLLSAGARPTAQTIELAAQAGDVELVRLLLSYNPPLERALKVAVEHENFKLVAMLSTDHSHPIEGSLFIQHLLSDPAAARILAAPLPRGAQATVWTTPEGIRISVFQDRVVWAGSVWAGAERERVVSRAEFLDGALDTELQAFWPNDRAATYRTARHADAHPRLAKRRFDELRWAHEFNALPLGPPINAEFAPSDVSVGPFSGMLAHGFNVNGVAEAPGGIYIRWHSRGLGIAGALALASGPTGVFHLTTSSLISRHPI